MKTPFPAFTLTNDHLCSFTDGGKSTYVFHTSPIVLLPEKISLDSDSKRLKSGADTIQLDRE